MRRRVPETVVIAGALAQKPGQAGHTWQFLQYLLGFRRLGWNVTFVDRLEPGMCVDRAGSPASFERSWNLRYLERVMREFGLQRDFSLIYNGGESTAGLDKATLLRRVRESVMLVNVMGFLNDPEILDAARRRVYLDTDPGFPQMWQELHLAHPVTGHDRYVTIAENIGLPECTIPTLGVEWIRWRQPVVLDQWPVQPHGGEWFTGIGSWRGPYAPVEYRGQVYGLRVHEFRKFMELPRRTDRGFQVALDIDSAERGDLERLEANGWSMVDPRTVGADPLRYREFIQTSKAEFMVAKGMYVATRSGWFSERSLCYLASGKPVVAQDTGLGDLFPSGEGLVTFSTIEEAVDAVMDVSDRYAVHSEAARSVAETYFDSDTRLTELVSEAAA
jgi:hypothetical protein